jgi:hypothetical protein
MVIIMTILFIKRQYGVMQNKKTMRHAKPGNAYTDSIMLVPLSRQEVANAAKEISLN